MIKLIFGILLAGILILGATVTADQSIVIATTTQEQQEGNGVAGQTTIDEETPTEEPIPQETPTEEETPTTTPELNTTQQERAPVPQQETLQASGSTASQAVEDLDAKLTELQGEGAERIKIDCKLYYKPPWTLECEISWLSPGPGSSTAGLAVSDPGASGPKTPVKK